MVGSLGARRRIQLQPSSRWCRRGLMERWRCGEWLMEREGEYGEMEMEQIRKQVIRGRTEWMTQEQGGRGCLLTCTLICLRSLCWMDRSACLVCEAASSSVCWRETTDGRAICVFAGKEPESLASQTGKKDETLPPTRWATTRGWHALCAQ